MIKSVWGIPAPAARQTSGHAAQCFSDRQGIGKVAFRSGKPRLRTQEPHQLLAVPLVVLNPHKAQTRTEPNDIRLSELSYTFVLNFNNPKLGYIRHLGLGAQDCRHVA